MSISIKIHNQSRIVQVKIKNLVFFLPQCRM